MLHEKIIAHFLKASKEASIEVLSLLSLARIEEDFTITCIGEGGDESLLIDVKAERVFFSYFDSFTAIYSEEYGAFGSGDYRVVLDPIDGSDNFVSNFPYYGASMALQYQNHTIAAFVCNFANKEYFYRKIDEAPKRGFLDKKQVRPLTINPHAKVGIFEKSALHTKVVDKLMINKLKFRSPGAVALSLVYSFDARFMIFMGKKRIFDIEAGLFICESLYSVQTDDYMILSHDKSLLDKLKVIVLEEIA